MRSRGLIYIENQEMPFYFLLLNVIPIFICLIQPFPIASSYISVLGT
ncbi:uncharacterized protein Dvar_53210 [Desulfosarcina variabilis str. Montpellier]